ncbi:hypothetical protein D9M71_636520 [compost metagenome]
MLPHREHPQALLQRQHQEGNQGQDQGVLPQQGAVQHVLGKAQDKCSGHADFMWQGQGPEGQQQRQPHRPEHLHELRQRRNAEQQANDKGQPDHPAVSAASTYHQFLSREGGAAVPLAAAGVAAGAAVAGAAVGATLAGVAGVLVAAGAGAVGVAPGATGSVAPGRPCRSAASWAIAASLARCSGVRLSVNTSNR